ncbi:unnamed protein product [Pieris macdunnoughi]|uniref:Secreted protein n=1 Tax=Pieris macdunnoughi TaxID=345717 RepID=A0A821MZ29_9NEOP|nr:unnamed protein product [Pieris macdunnoughi]
MQPCRKVCIVFYSIITLRAFSYCEQLPLYLKRSWPRYDLRSNQERPLDAAANARIAFQRGAGAGCGVFTPPQPCQLSGGTLYLGCAVNIRSKYGKRLPPRGGVGTGSSRQKRVKVESSPPPRTRVRAVTEGFLYLNSIATCSHSIHRL